MSNPLGNYTAYTTNWRETIRKNNNRTHIVIGLFFLMYALIGLLVDMYIHLVDFPNAPLSTLFLSLITFKIVPVATIVLLIIAAICLWISYKLSDRLMLLGTNAHQINAETAQTPAEKQLYNVVEEMKIASGLYYMPKVYVLNVDYMNAFASGYSEESAMVAITRGLMEKLNRDELQAVMAHELSHIRRLDIKLTMTAALLSNITIIVLDLLFYNALLSNRSSSSRSRNRLSAIIVLLRYFLPIVSVLLLLYLSRTREFMADAGAVSLMRTNEPLASALMKIHRDHQENTREYSILYQRIPHENIRREAYLYDPSQAGINSLHSISDLFSTHPSLAARLAAIGFKVKK